ncbi:NAD(P)H-dependent oxidoreductase [Aurantivibrio infirmus]
MSNKILFLAGSARKDSMNKKLARHAYEVALSKGADATFIDLKDFSMPIYDGDDEAESGLPKNALKLKQIFVEHQGLFIASPEYNSSFSPLLKNALDWISRPGSKDEKPLIAYAGKVAALSAASPGHYGGIRGLVPLRMMLGNIQVNVLPQQVAIPFYGKAFNDQGVLEDENSIMLIDTLVSQLIEHVKLLN